MLGAPEVIAQPLSGSTLSSKTTKCPFISSTAALKTPWEQLRQVHGVFSPSPTWWYGGTIWSTVGVNCWFANMDSLLWTLLFVSGSFLLC